VNHKVRFSSFHIKAGFITDPRFAVIKGLQRIAIVTGTIKVFIDFVTLLAMPVAEVFGKVIIGLHDVVVTVDDSDIERYMLKHLLVKPINNNGVVLIF